VSNAFTITMTDLGFLCRILQWRFFQMASPAVYLGPRSGSSEAPRMVESIYNRRSAGHSITTQISGLDALLSPDSVPALTQSFFAILESNLLGACQRVQLHGLSPSQASTRAIIKRMALDIIDVPAFIWNWLQLAKEAKATADGFYRRNNYSAAVTLYTKLGEHSLATPIFDENIIQLASQSGACVNHLAQIAMITGDACLTGALLALGQYNLGAAQRSGSMKNLTSDLLVRGGLHVVGLQYGDNQENPFYRLSHGHLRILLQVLKWSTLGEVALHSVRLSTMLQLAPGDEYIAHDYELLQGFLRDQRFPEARECLDASSVCALPPRCFDPPTPINAAPPPDTSDGWSPADFSKAEQENIHHLQDRAAQKDGKGITHAHRLKGEETGNEIHILRT